MDLRRILDRLQSSSVDGIVALLIAIFVPVLFHAFRVRLGYYPQTELWGGITVYVMVVVFDFFVLRNINSVKSNRISSVISLVIYGCTVLFFVIATFAQGVHSRGQISPAPIYLSLVLLGMGLIVRVRLDGSFAPASLLFASM